jgi:hypothetical protein
VKMSAVAVPLPPNVEAKVPTVRSVRVWKGLAGDDTHLRTNHYTYPLQAIQQSAQALMTRAAQSGCAVAQSGRGAAIAPGDAIARQATPILNDRTSDIEAQT